MKKIALVLGLIGAGMLALNLNLTALAYCVMLCSGMIWIVLLWKTEKEAALLNIGFSIINVIGIVRITWP